MCILYTAIRYIKRSDSPLSILGDALQPFLQEPDCFTKGMSISSKADLVSNPEEWRNPTPKP